MAGTDYAAAAPAARGYGLATCSTAAATVAKTATLSSYAKVANSTVSVKFTYDVPASATLNINSTGAASIYYQGAAIKAGVIKAGDIATFVYSTQYHLVGIDRSCSDAAEIENLRDDVYASSASGAIAQFYRATNGLPVDDLTIDITPVQAGTGDPSPTNVRAISGRTGASVTRNGHNFCTTPVVGKTYHTSTGAYTDSSTAAASDKVKVDFADGYITLSHHANIRCMLFAWDKNGTFVGRTAGKTPDGTNTVFTVAPTGFSSGSGTQDYNSIVFVAARFYESTGESDPIATAMAAAYPQIELGSTATTYEPYSGSTTSISWQTEAGTVYGGTLDVTTGVLTAKWGRVDMADDTSLMAESEELKSLLMKVKEEN